MNKSLFNKVILITPFKYTFKNFSYLYVQLCNILNLNVHFDSWYIIISNLDNISKETIYYIENEIYYLLMHYDYEVYLDISKKSHPAHIKANFFEKMKHEYGDNAEIFYISLDSDRIFEYNNFSNLVNSLTITNKEFVLYPVIDVANMRKYKNYIDREIDENEYYKVIEMYGYEVLPYIKLKFNKYNYFINTPIGGSGFAIHHRALTEERINLLKNFEENTRGHDVILADTFENKYILTDSWALHLGAENYDSYWKKTDKRVEKIFNKVRYINE